MQDTNSDSILNEEQQLTSKDQIIFGFHKKHPVLSHLFKHNKTHGEYNLIVYCEFILTFAMALGLFLSYKNLVGFVRLGTYLVALDLFLGVSGVLLALNFREYYFCEKNKDLGRVLVGEAFTILLKIVMLNLFYEVLPMKKRKCEMVGYCGIVVAVCLLFVMNLRRTKKVQASLFTYAHVTTAAVILMHIHRVFPWNYDGIFLPSRVFGRILLGIGLALAFFVLFALIVKSFKRTITKSYSILALTNTSVLSIGFGMLYYALQSILTKAPKTIMDLNTATVLILMFISILLSFTIGKFESENEGSFISDSEGSYSITTPREASLPIVARTVKILVNISRILTFGRIEDSKTAKSRFDIEPIRCVKCEAEKPEAMILPCNHAGICRSCASEFDKQNTCFYCGQEVRSVVSISKIDQYTYVIKEQLGPKED